MADGFHISELTKFEKKLLSLANNEMPKQSRQFIKKEANKLNSQNKRTYKSMGIGIETGNLEKGFRAGKAYKYKGDWTARAYNNSPHAHLIDKGFMHKPHKGQDGQESFVPGYNFMDSAASAFQGKYYDDVQKFIDDMLDKGL